MSETFAYDNLFAGSQQPIVNAPAVIAAGENIVRGALLGRILREVGDVEADRTNTGDGTIGGAVLGLKAKVGTYRITCIDVGAPAVFQVLDPDGIRLEDAVAEVTYAGAVGFLVEAYGTPFALGDEFTFDVDAGSLQCVQGHIGATDGRAEPYAVAAEDCDATLAAVTTSVYRTGEFAEDNVTYFAGQDADDWREVCAAVGIYLRPTVAV